MLIKISTPGVGRREERREEGRREDKRRREEKRGEHLLIKFVGLRVS